MICHFRPNQHLTKSSRHLCILQRVKLLLCLSQYYMTDTRSHFIKFEFFSWSALHPSWSLNPCKMHRHCFNLHLRLKIIFRWFFFSMKIGRRLIIGSTSFTYFNIIWIESDLTKFLTTHGTAELHKLLKLNKKISFNM